MAWPPVVEADCLPHTEGHYIYCCAITIYFNASMLGNDSKIRLLL